MKAFATTLTLLASIAFAQEDQRQPDEPDNSQFPDEWQRCTDARSCNHDVNELIKYDDGMRADFDSITDVRVVPKRAYCKMQTNPGYRTTYPYGYYHLWQPTPAAPVYIWGWMQNLPYSNKRYALTINERRWDGKDCCSAGRHYQLPGQTHGWNNSNPAHHIGDLWGCFTWGTSCWHFQSAQKPSLWSAVGQPSIYYKTMTVYEDSDDYGFGGTWDSKEYGSAGPRIACCVIRPYFIDWEQAEPQKLEPSRDGGRRLAAEAEGVDVFTPDQFRELFGFEPEKLEGEEDWFTQN